MTIPCAMVRITPEQAAAAACAEHPDLITRISWLIVPKLRRETRLLQLSLFYCKYYIVWGTVSGPQGKCVRCTAAMNSALNLVRKVVGTPETSDQDIDSGQIVQDQYTIGQAEEKIREFMVRSSYKMLRGLGRVSVECVETAYRPYYMCLCEKNGKIYRRVVDATLGERDYLLEYQYKHLKFLSAPTE